MKRILGKWVLAFQQCKQEGREVVLLKATTIPRQGRLFN